MTPSQASITSGVNFSIEKHVHLSNVLLVFLTEFFFLDFSPRRPRRALWSHHREKKSKKAIIKEEKSDLSFSLSREDTKDLTRVV